MTKKIFIVGLVVMVNLLYAQSNGDKLSTNTSETKVKQISLQMISSSDESVPTPRGNWGAFDTNSKSKQVSKTTTKNQPKLPAKNAKGKAKARTKTKPQMYFIPPVIKEEVDSDTIKMYQLGDSKTINNVGDIDEQNKRTGNEISNLKGDEPKNQVGETIGLPLDYFDNDSEIIELKPNVKASFPGGEVKFREYIQRAFQYPVRCQDYGISGSVVLRFIVDSKGQISDIKVITETKTCPEFTTEAIRILRKSPKWVPGQNNGRFIKSYREVPIRLSVQ